DKAIESKDNQVTQLNESIKVIDGDLKKALSDYEVLQKIKLEAGKAIEHQKTIEESREKDVEIQQNISQAKLKEKEAHVAQLNTEIQRVHHEIDVIHNSISWRTLTPIKKRYDRIFHRNKKESLSQSAQFLDQSTASQSETSNLNVVVPAATQGKEVKVSPKL